MAWLPHERERPFEAQGKLAILLEGLNDLGMVM